MTEVQSINTGLQPDRIHRWIRRFVVVLPLLVVVTAGAATFTASLDHDTILLGDAATLSLKFEDGQPSGTPQPPPVTGLQFKYIGPSSFVSFVNGQTSSTLTHNFQVKPTQTGEFEIPSIMAKVGNETLTSQPVKFKVVRAPAAQPGSEAEQQALALLRFAVPKQEVFVGETIVVEQRLLIRAGVQSVPGLDIPALQLPGCAIGKTMQGQQRQTVIGSATFTVVPFYVPLTVLRPGKISIGPVEGAVVVELPSRNRQPDFPDPFGFGIINRGVQQRVAVSSPEVSLNALPLPEQGKPKSFSGAVGQFQMNVSASPTNVAVGDPVTIRVQVAGRGALDSITLPEQPAWNEFKIYPPTVKTETTGDLGLEGTRTFEQVVVPQNTEIKELPVLAFAYFDPEKRSYHTLQHPATPLLVRPSGSSPAPTLAVNNPKSDAPTPVQDIVHIKPRLGNHAGASRPWVQQPVFIVMQGVPVFALLGAILWRRRQDSLANNPRLRRQRQVERLVQAGLAELPTLAAQRNSDQFFALVFRLLQEQIGERLGMPASAITEAVVDDKLVPGGLTMEAAQALHGLFQQCNQARYAPVQSLHELAAVIPRLEAVLEGMKEVRV
jgi:hypothetical protein